MATGTAVYTGSPDIVMNDMEQQQGGAGVLDQPAGVNQCRSGAVGKIHRYQDGVSREGRPGFMYLCHG